MQVDKIRQRILEDQSNPKTELVQTLERDLMALQLEKTRLDGEYARLPEFNRNLGTKKRREYLELELAKVESRIKGLRSKLREFSL